jgi:hypothetical protein
MQQDNVLITFFDVLANARQDSIIVNVFKRLPRVIGDHLAKIDSGLNLIEEPVFLVQKQCDFDANPLSPIPMSVFENESQGLLNGSQSEFFEIYETLFEVQASECWLAWLNGFAEELSSKWGTPAFAAICCFFLQAIFPAAEVQDVLNAVEMVFDSRYTFFENESVVLRKLRQRVLEIMLMKFPNQLSVLILRSTKTAFLFAEIIGRIHSRLDLVTLGLLLDETLVEIITDNLINLQKEKTLAAHRAWSTIFVFLEFIFKNHEVLDFFFRSSGFAHYFLGLYTLESVRPSLFSVLHTLFSNSTNANIVVRFCREMLENGHRPHISFFLEQLAERLVYYPDLVHVFADLGHHAVSLFIDSPEVALQVLPLISVIMCHVDTFCFTDSELFRIATVFRKLEATDEGNILLASILARRKSVSFSTTFLIQYSQFILPVLSYVSLSISIRAFSGLCRYSISNCIAVHEGGLDLFLIELISNFGKQFCFRGIEFESSTDNQFIVSLVFPLLNQIATFSCTSEVAARYIELAVPLENGEFPRFAEATLNSLSRILSILSRVPSPFYEFCTGAESLSFPPLDSHRLINGFAFAAWVLADVPIGQSAIPQCLLFSMMGNHSKSVFLFLNGVALCIQFSGPTGISSIVLTNSFSNGVWHFISLFFTAQTNDLIGHLYYGVDSDVLTPFLVKNPSFGETPIQIQIGGYIDNLPVSVPFFWLGPAKFSPNAVSNPSALWTSGSINPEIETGFPRLIEKQSNSSLC